MTFVRFDSPASFQGSPAPFQIVATVGPASAGLVAEMAQAGATGFRLNASHLDPAGVAAALERIERACPAAPVVVDLQGAKMRLGDLAAREVVRGERLRFALSDEGGAVPVPHPELFAALAAGEVLSGDDDRLRFEVVAVGESDLDAVVARGGRLRARQSFNRAEHPVALRDLTARDQAAVAVAGARAAYAVSFMTDGREASWIRDRVPGAVVIGKLERKEAIAALPSVAAATGACWICRGDLLAQLGSVPLARWVSSFSPSSVDKPVLMAGQVLEHLSRHAEPTRSELCHLYDLVARGYAGIVLSDETAVGSDPVRAVGIAAALVQDFAASR